MVFFKHFDRNFYLYISRKNDRPLKEVCALVVDACTGQQERPSIPANTIFCMSQYIARIIATPGSYYNALNDV